MHASAARGDQHLRGLAKNGFDLVDDGVSFGECAAGGHGVVQNEGAFVHLWQQVGTQGTVGKVAGDKQNDPDDRKGPGPLDGEVESLAVGVEDAPHHGAVFVVSLGLAFLGFAEERERKGRREAESQHKRRKQRGSHGNGKGTEEAAGYAGDDDERKEDDDGRDGGADQRGSDLGKGRPYGFSTALSGIAVDDDIFYDDDGVIDDETDGCGQTAERHQIEALAYDPEKEDRDRDRDGDDEARNQGRGPVAQEEEEDDAG